MRQFSAIVLLILYSLYWLRTYIPIVHYQTQRDYIVNELCENRDMPEMNCEGRCYMRKYMAQLDISGQSPKAESENSKPTQSKRSKPSVDYELYTQGSTTQLAYIVIAGHIVRPLLYQHWVCTDIFHPPRHS